MDVGSARAHDVDRAVAYRGRGRVQALECESPAIRRPGRSVILGGGRTRLLRELLHVRAVGVHREDRVSCGVVVRDGSERAVGRDPHARPREGGVLVSEAAPGAAWADPSQVAAVEAHRVDDVAVCAELDEQARAVGCPRQAVLADTIWAVSHLGLPAAVGVDREHLCRACFGRDERETTVRGSVRACCRGRGSTRGDSRRNSDHRQEQQLAAHTPCRSAHGCSPHLHSLPSWDSENAYEHSVATAVSRVPEARVLATGRLTGRSGGRIALVFGPRDQPGVASPPWSE